MEEYKSVNLIFFYYLLWMEETRHVPLPKELVEYKYHPALRLNDEDKKELWDEGTKNGPDRSALLGHNFVYQETKSHGFYSSYFHQRISS